MNDLKTNLGMSNHYHEQGRRIGELSAFDDICRLTAAANTGEVTSLVIKALIAIGMYGDDDAAKFLLKTAKARKDAIMKDVRVAIRNGKKR